MAKGDTRWQQMHFSLTDFVSTMLHRLDFGLKFGGIAIFFLGGGVVILCSHDEQNDTKNNFGGGRMGDSIRYPNMGTVAKAADIYGLSPAYIRRLCKTGKIKYVNAGHRWLVNLDSLARYFEQGDPADGEEAFQGIRRVAR